MQRHDVAHDRQSEPAALALHMLAAAVELERTTRISMELIRRQLGKGYVDRLALLNAEQAHHQAALALAQAQATRLGDTAALFQALGGGWWNRPAGEVAGAQP